MGMEQLKDALETLDETISDLEDKIGIDNSKRQLSLKNQIEMLKMSRTREANAMAVAQKVASRLDDAINHVENILRH